MTIQHEVGAWIAGFIDSNENRDFTEIDIKNTADKIINRYILSIDFEGIKWFTKKSSSDRAEVNIDLINAIFNPQQVIVGTPPEEWITMINAYANKPGSGGSDNRQQFIEDMQLLVDEFINEGGYFTTLRADLKSNIEHSLQFFKSLAEYRKDPYQALLEVSLLPLSHWDVYVKRELSKSSINKK